MAYKVSDAYKVAVEKPTRMSKISGSLKLVTGTTITISNEVISSGSLYLTNQCVNGDEFQYGSVFAAELGLTITTEIDRYSLFDGEINLTHHLLVGDDTYEAVPLGIFYVSETTRTGKNISIKAHDAMIKFEKETEEIVTGTAYELLSYCCDKCQVPLGMTSTELEKFPNTKKILSFDNSYIKTYRDGLSYISTALCGFAIIDREGKLVIKHYSEEITHTKEARVRSSSKFSDFNTYYSSAKAKCLANGSYGEYGISEEGDGLSYDFGELPVIQGLTEDNQACLNEMFKVLKTVNYVPCEVTFPTDPTIDVGDKIKNIDAKGNEVVSLVTFFKWVYRGSETIKSAGLNPRMVNLKKKEKDFDTSSLQAEIAKKDVPIYTYTNPSEKIVKGGTSIRDYKEIVRLAFASSSDCTTVLFVTVPFEMDHDGFFETITYLDSVQMENASVTKYCAKGKNVLTFVNYLDVKKNVTYKLNIFARTFQEETDERIYQSKVDTNSNAVQAIMDGFKNIVKALKSGADDDVQNLSDTIAFDNVIPINAVPTAKIPKLSIKAVLFGQGLAGKVNWDGTITFEEIFEAENMDIPMMKLKLHDVRGSFNETLATIKPKKPSSKQFTEVFSKQPFNLPKVQFEETSFIEKVLFSEKVTNYTFRTKDAKKYVYDNKYISTKGQMFSYITNYEYICDEQEIDEGTMVSTKIITSDKQSIESLEVTKK